MTNMFDKFSERHIGVSNEKDLKAMLEVIGAKSVDELIWLFSEAWNTAICPHHSNRFS